MPVNLIQADWQQTGDVAALVIDLANGNIIDPASTKVASWGTDVGDLASGAVLSSSKSSIVTAGRIAEISGKLDLAAASIAELTLWAFASSAVDPDGIPTQGYSLTMTADPAGQRIVTLKRYIPASPGAPIAAFTLPGSPTTITRMRAIIVESAGDYLIAVEISEDGGATYDRVIEFTDVAPAFTEVDWRFAFHFDSPGVPALIFADNFTADDGTLVPVVAPFPFTDDFEDASWS